MRKLSLTLALVVGLFGFSSTANAGIVDVTLDTATGQVTLRTDVGIELIQLAIQFGGASGAAFNIGTGGNVDPGASFSFGFGADLIAALGPPAIPGEVIGTAGLTSLIGTLAPGAVTSLDCANCLSALGGGVVDQNLGDITAQTMYIIAPEPAALALLGLGLAGLAFVRRSAA